MSEREERRESVVGRALEEIRELRKALQASQSARTEPIAIVGMGCRMPAADGPAAFWDLVRGGTDAVTDIPSTRWDVDAFYDPDVKAAGKAYSRRGAFLDDVDSFDAAFFGISPREAAHMDPQQRLFLEVSWEALENAGQPMDDLGGTKTGVFVGVTGTDYSQSIMQQLPPSELDAYVLTGTASTFAAGRLSYWLGLQGPSLSLDTACSSSLVAVHLACQSLRAGECSMALAGGVNTLLAPEGFVVLSRANMLSPDGRCKTFDKDANGYVRGEGCGVVVLKRLADAVAEGDHIHAVIRGSAVNQDGRSSGITVPNGNAQQAVIRDALATAGVAGAQVGYVEAHGTGTALGDPIEVRALSAVLGEGRDPASPIALGSVKTNIGHLEPAAGVAGLIKTVLALRNEQIPPLLHLREVNPEIEIDKLPVSLPTTLTPWPRQAEPRLAGVSSFGASGTNAHVVVQEAPESPRVVSAVTRPEHLVSLSARSEEALRALAERYVRHFDGDDISSLADVGFTANTGRAKFGHRLAIKASTVGELGERLADFLAGRDGSPVYTGVTKPRARTKVAFLFTGQGSQYAQMGRELYLTQPGFRADLDRCDEILADKLDRSLLSVIFEDSAGEAGALIDTTRYTQPAMFALQYALARLWMRWGVRPAAMLGHSVGEFAAACIAGVLTLEDGLRLVAERARLMAELPGGGAMAAVFASEEQVSEAIARWPDQLAVAAVNGPANVVISGAAEPLEKVLGELEEQGIKARKLTVSHAFHSPLLDPMLDEFHQLAAEVPLHPARVPLISNLTGDVIGKDTLDAGYFRDHARSPVRFADGLRCLIERGCEAFVEIGPAPHLCGIAKNSVPGGDYRWLASLRKGRGEWSTLLGSLGELFTAGVDVDWVAFDEEYDRHRVELPTYPFERKRHWFATPETPRPGQLAVTAAPSPVPLASTTLLGQRISTPLDVVQYQAELSSDVHPSLADCVSGGITVVNAGFHLETVVQAARELHGDAPVRVEGIVMPQALILPETGRITTQLVVSGGEGDRRTFTYHSKDPADGDEWSLHSQGAFSTADADKSMTGRQEIDAIAARCTTEITGASFYRSLWQRRIHLGPSAQWLASIARRDGEALARVRAADPEELANGYLLHPGIVDSALQLLIACLELDETGSVGETVVMLLEIQEFLFHGHDGGPLLCHAALRDDPGSAETVTADIVLMSESGRCVARMNGVHMKATSQERLLRAITSTQRRASKTSVPAAPVSSALAASIRELIEAGEETSARDQLRSLLTETAASALGCAAADISTDNPLNELGMDSLLAVEFQERVSTALATAIPAAWFLDLPSVASLEAKVFDTLASTTDTSRVAGSLALTTPKGTEYTSPGGMHVVEFGTGEPVIFVHGGVFGGLESWQTQLPLAQRRRLIIVSRPGYGDSAPSEREDFLEDGRLLVELLGEGAHIVAQSYGTLGAMVAAAARPEAVRSLTLIESAASMVARGRPAVDDYERTMKALFAVPPEDPAELFRKFFAIIEPGASFPDPLPAPMRSFATRMASGGNWPWEADVPVDAVRAAAFPTLVISGGQRPVFEEISDALADRLGGERLIVPGGHGTQNVGAPFNEALEAFLDRAQQTQHTLELPR